MCRCQLSLLIVGSILYFLYAIINQQFFQGCRRNVVAGCALVDIESFQDFIVVKITWGCKFAIIKGTTCHRAKQTGLSTVGLIGGGSDWCRGMSHVSELFIDRSSHLSTKLIVPRF